MEMGNLAIIGALAVALQVPAAIGANLTAAQAAIHLGENETVCGTVASAKFAAKSRGTPTFLNLDKPYPQPIFTAVIWGDSRPRFSPPPETLRGESICVSGLISNYRGVPQIVVNDPAQITRGP